MLLLVSVRNASEASSAVAGGADIIDAKEPTAGALGAVTIATFRDIHGAVGHARPVSAALGDATDEQAVEQQALTFASAGAEFVKVGVSGLSNTRSLLAAAVRGSRATVAVVCADVSNRITREELVDIAAEAGARGILLDTANKDGPGLSALVSRPALTRWVACARSAGLLVALAGKLTTDDLPFACDTGADIVGVRGAACDDGRNGTISQARVRFLVSSLRNLQMDRAGSAVR